MIHFHSTKLNTYAFRRRRCQRRGGTLVEVMISALIVGALIVPTLRMLGSVATSYSRRGNQDVARKLAEDMLSEIMQSRFADADINVRVFGPEPNESTVDRSQFDDVDDYHNRIEQPPQRKDGSPLSEFAAFRREVTVVYVDPADPDVVSVSATALKRIQVLVDHNGQVSTVHGLRASTGVFEIQPETAATCVRHVGVDLGLDATNSPLVSGSEVLNQFPAAQ